MRFFARAKLDLPVNLNGRFSGSGAIFTDLSLNGAFIRGQFPSLKVGDSPFLKYDLPGYGSFDHSGKTVRKDADGVGVVFYGLDSASKVKLLKTWKNAPIAVIQNPRFPRSAPVAAGTSIFIPRPTWSTTKRPSF